MEANIDSNWESDWGLPQEEAKGKGLYKANAEAKQGTHLVDYSLRLPYLRKPRWLFVIGCS